MFASHRVNTQSAVTASNTPEPAHGDNFVIECTIGPKGYVKTIHNLLATKNMDLVSGGDKSAIAMVHKYISILMAEGGSASDIIDARRMLESLLSYASAHPEYNDVAQLQIIVKSLIYHAVTNNNPLILNDILLSVDERWINMPLDNQGNTALHLAAAQQSDDICVVLLEWGAKKDIQNHAHQTAGGIASTIETLQYYFDDNHRVTERYDQIIGFVAIDTDTEDEEMTSSPSAGSPSTDMIGIGDDMFEDD